MRSSIILLVFVLSLTQLSAQVPFNAAAPNGYTKRAMLSEQVGLTEVSITYHRPSVRGREGKIWGETVHKGFINQGFGKGNPAPWRAGANENTVMEFSTDVKLEGQLLPKGKYGLFIAFDPAESIVIFSKRSDAWGSFFYDDKEDALRVKVKPVPLDKAVETLQYEFTNHTTNSAVVVLSWEKLSIPFKIEVDYLKQQFEAFVAEAQNPKGFTSQGLNIAASWALQNNYQLEKALEWANTATGTVFPGDPTSFAALSTRVLILEKLKRPSESSALVKTMLPLGNMNQLQQLGRQLLANKNVTLALEVFRHNHEKHPGQFISLSGMVRGLSANAAYPEALEYANKAMLLAPNAATKEALANMIEKLKQGKDIN